jgi:hypothetical protein
MDNLIKKLRKKAFSGQDILTVCDDKTKIITYPQLYEYSDIHEVLSPYDNVVILYETKPQYGHWITVLKHPESNTIEFFDSYGLFCDDQLDFISNRFRKENNEVYPKLSEMLYNSQYKIIYNKTQLQKYRQDISSCGRHVAFRIVMKDTPLHEYVKLLTDNMYDPDTVVTYLTAFM